MAGLPPVKKILREDLPDAPSWIERLLIPVNQFFESVYNALDRNLTFESNITAQKKTVNFTTGASYDGTAANFTTVKFQRTLRSKPSGLLLMQIVQDEDSHTPIEGGVFIDWLDINGTIEIYNVTGLTASKTYALSVMLI